MPTKSPLERAVGALERAFSIPAAIWMSLSSGALGKPLRWIGRVGSWYKNRIWTRYTRNDEGKVTGKRVAAVLFATAFALWIIPSVITGLFSAALMGTTMRTENVFLSSAQEIDPDGDVHAIRGCRSIKCGEADAIYYHVRPDFAHTIYSWMTKGGPFYPDMTASVVAPGVNKCTVTSYGFRLRTLRGWGIYPDMLDATCEPYDAPDLAPDATP